MGRFIKETTVKVGIVGLEEPTAKKLIDRFTTATVNDPGTFEVMRFASLAECRNAVNSSKVNAVCIALDKFTVDESTAFIGDIRVTNPLVPFCLVGTQGFLDTLPGYHGAWRNKFAHYYKLASDVGDDDLSENAGLVRDLFISDSVKCRALGQYETTPGAVIRLQAPRPYGFWLLVVVSLLAALVGGSVGPALERLLPAAASNTSPANGAAQQGVAPVGTREGR